MPLLAHANGKAEPERPEPEDLPQASPMLPSRFWVGSLWFFCIVRANVGAAPSVRRISFTQRQCRVQSE